MTGRAGNDLEQGASQLGGISLTQGRGVPDSQLLGQEAAMGEDLLAQCVL